MNPDLFDALQKIEDGWERLREKEKRVKTKLERERDALELKQLLVEAANLMRYGRWHHSKTQEVAAVRRRLKEMAAA